MNASVSPIKRITFTTKTGNNTFPTTSTIETADFGHYQFFKLAKNVQKFLLIRLNAVNFFRFSQLLIDVKMQKTRFA